MHLSVFDELLLSSLLKEQLSAAIRVVSGSRDQTKHSQQLDTSFLSVAG